MIFETKPKLFSIGTITILDETISLLNVGVSNIKINGKSKLGLGISDERITKVMASTTKTTNLMSN